MEQWSDEAWTVRCQVTYKCQLSALYHRKRERFFALLDKLSSSLALVAGASAMSELLPTPQDKALAGAAVAAVTLPGVVFGWADRARAHAVLASKFIEIQAQVEALGPVSCERLDAFSSAALRIEMEEPAQLSTLTRLCQNELALASGHPESTTPVSWWHRKLAHFLDMPRTTA